MAGKIKKVELGTGESAYFDANDKRVNEDGSPYYDESYYGKNETEVHDPNNNSGSASTGGTAEPEKLSDVLNALEKENQELIGLKDLFDGLQTEQKDKEKELAEEFGKSVVEESGKQQSSKQPLDIELPELNAVSVNSSQQPNSAKSDKTFDDIDIELPELNAVSVNGSQDASNQTPINADDPNWLKSLDDLINSLAVPDFDFNKPENKQFPERGDEEYDDQMNELDKGFEDLHTSTIANDPNLDEYGPFLPDASGEDRNEPGQAALALDGGFDSCCEMLGTVFDKLSESINVLSEAVNKFADTLDPKEKLTEEQKEEKEYNKETGSMWNMFKSGLEHQYNADHKEGEKAPGGFAKNIGEKLGEMAGGKMAGIGEALAGGPGILSAFMGGVGAAATVATTFYETIKSSVDTVIEWNENLMRSNFQFAEYSASMSMAQARMEAREIEYSAARGEARSETADALAESWSDLKTAFAPISDFFANMLNKILTAINRILTAVLRLFGAPERSDETAGDRTLREMDDMSRSFLETFGTPTRFVFGR